VENFRFYPAQASLGFNTLTYTYGNGGCRRTIQTEVYVTAVPAVTFEKFDRVCDNDPIKLMDYVSPKGGTFTGAGVTDNVFYPTQAGLGTHEVAYATAVGTCTITGKSYLNVVGLSDNDASFRTLPEVCITDDSYLDLRGYLVNAPDNGTFTGTGVEGFRYYPARGKLGFSTITYSFTSGSCPKTIRAEVFVRSVPAVSFRAIPTVCTNTTVDLMSYVSAKGGTFSGQGVSSGRFYPAQAKVGINTLTYTYGAGVCQKTVKADVNVLGVATTRPIALAKVCSDAPVQLMEHVNNKGGEFSGNGVQGSVFYPTYAGYGVHDIAYQVSINGCVSRASLQVEVLSVATPPTFENIPTLCKSDSGYIDLREYVLNYQEGTFSGQGVESYRFYPERAKDGFNTLTYTYGSGSCQRSLRTEIYITPKPELILTPFSRICEADTIDLSAHANLSGGTWSGKGVFGSNFIAEQAGTGSHTLAYTTTQGMCAVSGTVGIEVASLLPKAVTFTTPGSMCVQDLGFITLADYVQGHSGGTFSGTGVSSGRFYPAQAKVGFNTLTYAYGTGSCAKTIKIEIEVSNSSATKVAIAPLPKFCRADTINLLQYVSAKGGTFSGAGVVGDTLFLSEHAGVGTHELVYQVALNSCNSYATASATVLSLNRTDIRFKPQLPDFCSTQSEAVDLFDLVENSRDGYFSGKGVEQGRYFYPNKVGAEASTIPYTYGVGSCEQKVSADLKIYTAPNKGAIAIDDVLALCGGTLDLGAMVEPKGGAFAGAHITAAGVFDGNAAPLGETEVVYSVANKGCKLTKSILIKNEPAQTFDFSVDATAVAEGGKVRFVPEKGGMASYTWRFGDGAYSREVSPWHYYYHNGAFDVRLEVQNQLGCILSTTKAGLMEVGDDPQGRYVQAAGKRYYMNAPSAEELSTVENATGCSSLEVVVFPNPVSNGTLNIRHVECVERVEVYDLGMSLQLSVNAPAGSVSVGTLRPGMYLVTLKLVDGGLKVGKILIQ
jgi:hypothetical protein